MPLANASGYEEIGLVYGVFSRDWLVEMQKTATSKLTLRVTKRFSRFAVYPRGWTALKETQRVSCAMLENQP